MLFWWVIRSYIWEFYLWNAQYMGRTLLQLSFAIYSYQNNCTNMICTNEYLYQKIFEYVLICKYSSHSDADANAWSPALSFRVRSRPTYMHFQKFFFEDFENFDCPFFQTAVPIHLSALVNFFLSAVPMERHTPTNVCLTMWVFNIFLILNFF